MYFLEKNTSYPKSIINSTFYKNGNKLGELGWGKEGAVASLN